MEKNSKHYLKYLALVITAVLLFGCGAADPTEAPIPTQEITASPQLSATPEPTVTPTPLPPLAILLAPEGSDPGWAASIRQLYEDQAAQHGYRFEQRSELTEDDLEGTSLVVALPPFDGLGELAAAAAGVKFLAVGFNDLEPSDNLSVISTAGTAPDHQGFLAGYLAAILSSDWRVGIISVSDAPAGTSARDGFLNGAVYFCGLCRPSYPPYYDSSGNILSYPTFVELSSSASSEEWLQAAQAMIDRRVEVVYILPGGGSEEMQQVLAEAGVILIGGTEPAPGTGQQWAATVQPDLLEAFDALLAGLFEGRTGERASAVFELTNANPAYLTPGKIDLVQRLSADLIAGYIQPRLEPAGP